MAWHCTTDPCGVWAILLAPSQALWSSGAPWYQPPCMLSGSVLATLYPLSRVFVPSFAQNTPRKGSFVHWIGDCVRPMVVVSTGTCMTRTVHKRPCMRTGWHTQRPSGRTPHRTVAYLGPADTGPVLSRLRGDRQSVSHPQSGFATPHAVLLASIRTPCSRALPRGPPRRHVCDHLWAGARGHSITHDLSPYP